MNRVEFLNELEELLQDLETEEKMEALAFYDSYFEEAGELNEPVILRELGSPAKVAESIKKDLGAIKEEELGEYTERGYQSSNQSKDSIMKLNEVTTSDSKEANENELQSDTAIKQNSSYQSQSTADQTQSANNKNQETSSQKSNTADQNQKENYQNQNMHYQNTTYQNQRPVVKKTGINVFALILLCIFGFPILIPLMIACFATVFALVVGFGGAGIGCIVLGFSVFVMGVTKVFVLPLFGALSVGGGMICFGIGLLLFLVACACAKMFPALIRGLVSLLKAPFGGRSVAA
ncbi:HAAS signaling domain-containing protein [Lachnoclostridium phytofermentans]|uniref:HAAS signaling domain-containing protein n=1 Tax=Lachnoclostridium phytofermentans TaxID=66219 RepID=UPI0004960BAE|nr:DUF1700 domain-containing protein [Lachnoclostridium phytofermentans]